MQKGKKTRLLVGLLVCLAGMVMTITGCSNGKGKNDDGAFGNSKGKGKVIESVSYEAEDQALSGNLKVQKVHQGYSGSGYVDGFKDETDVLTFSVEIKEDDFYDLEFTSSSDGSKVNFVLVDGNKVGEFKTDWSKFGDSGVSRIYLTAGTHEIAVAKSWGWINLDKLTVVQSEALDEDIYNPVVKLSNPNATESTKRLFSYLLDIYGKQMLTGQNCDTGMIGTEMSAINKETGEYPAVLGLDFMNYSPCNASHGVKGNSTEFAKSYVERGGIVTFCWHWTMPDEYVKGNWYSSFYTDSCSFRLDKALSGEDANGYQALMDGIDAIAKQLLILQESDVPVLWRPLHEASGGWFWWGAAGADAYIELYRLMHDKLTNEYGCNNLIWLWNGQDKDWYPGDEYVDIIGTDIYPGNHVYTSQIDKFLECTDCSTERKMVVLSENGCLFDPDVAVRDGAMWGFQCTWGGEFVLKNSKFANYGEDYTEVSMLQKVYSSEHMITRSELPDLKTYPIRKELEKKK